MLGSPSIRICSKSGVDSYVSLAELADMIGFTYTAHLMFLCDSDIRSMHMWERSPSWQCASALAASLRDAASRCQPHSRLCVRYVSDFMGYGLFADALVPAGCLICEYTGVVKTRPSFSAYAVSGLLRKFISARQACCYAYMRSPLLPQVMYPGPSGPDSGEIDAAEFGSVARLINHSARPNCIFKRVLLGGLMRVLCCTSQVVAEGEVLTMNYGSSYWRTREGCLKPE